MSVLSKRRVRAACTDWTVYATRIDDFSFRVSVRAEGGEPHSATVEATEEGFDLSAVDRFVDRLWLPRGVARTLRAVARTAERRMGR